MPLKIIRLTVENIKRLYAVEIEVKDGSVVLVTGRNAQGKSSLLDAITAALAGLKGRGAAKKLLREGAEKGYIKLDLGDLIVERMVTATRSSLKVTPRVGSAYSNPQEVLDDLISKVAFDPSAFVNKGRKDQIAELLRVVPLEIDLGELADERAKLYDERRDANKEVDRLATLCDTAAAHADAPDEPLSVAELAKELQDARHHNHKIGEAKTEHLILRDKKLPELENRVNVARADLERLTAELANAKIAADNLEQGILREEKVDTAALEDQIANVETLNEHYRENKKREEYHEAFALAKMLVEKLEVGIEVIDKSKTEALAKAEFPLPGLSFDEENVLYNNIPFADCATSEQLKIAVAVAMADNPDIRVITMRHGSVFDDETLAALTAVAEDKEFQLWVEQVSEGEDGPSVVIEDGYLVNPDKYAVKGPTAEGQKADG